MPWLASDTPRHPSAGAFPSPAVSASRNKAVLVGLCNFPGGSPSLCAGDGRRCPTLERARWYRTLAGGADEQISAELLYLAEQYEALAREMEQDGPPSTDQ
jgi:hypothetical protein